MTPRYHSLRPRRWTQPWLLAFTVVLLFSLNACSWLIKPPEDQSPARRIIESVVDRNNGLMRYKCLAQVHLSDEGESIKGRIALAATAPNRMRVEWLSMLGQPLTSLAGDGEVITVLFHSSSKMYRMPQLRTALERVLHIPIGIEDLLSILSGRPPLPDYSAAQLRSGTPGGERVVLKNRWRGIVARLEMDQATNRIRNMQVFDGAGTMVYEVQWRQWQRQGSYDIPKKVIIRAQPERSVTLTVDRFWPNAEVSPDTFVLEKPDRST